MRKYFGTDGVRGVANTELSCELSYKLGRAGGYVLTKGKEDKHIKVVVGRDTRIFWRYVRISSYSGTNVCRL